MTKSIVLEIKETKKGQKYIYIPKSKEDFKAGMFVKLDLIE